MLFLLSMMMMMMPIINLRWYSGRITLVLAARETHCSCGRAETLRRGRCVGWGVREVAEEDELEDGVSDLSWDLEERHCGSRAGSLVDLGTLCSLQETWFKTGIIFFCLRLHVYIYKTTYTKGIVYNRGLQRLKWME